MFFNKKLNYFILGSLILSFLILSPVLDSGYISDDELNSLIPGILLEDQTNVISFTSPYINKWIVEEGRFFPLSFIYGYSLFSLNPPLFLYKLFLIFAILINALLFSYLVWRFTKSNIIASFSLLIIPIFFKITLSYCPILSFNGLIQTTFFLILLSLITLMAYLKTLKKYYFIISIFLFLLSILTYEIAIPLLLIFILLIINNNKEKSYIKEIKTSIPYIIVAVFCIIIPKIIKFSYKIPGYNNASLYSINPNPVDFIICFAKEISGVIPLSYILVNPEIILDNFTLFLNITTTLLLIIIGLVSFFLFFEISQKYVSERNKSIPNHKLKIFFLLFGMCLLLLPLIATSITYRHQSDSMWGYSYLPGYISAYGGCICAIIICGHIFSKTASLSTKKATCLLIFFSFLFSLACMITFSANTIVVERTNLDSLYPRQIVEESMNNGIFNEIQNNSILLVDNNHSWDQPSFYRMHSGIHFRYIGSPQTPIYDGPYFSQKMPHSNSTESSNSLCQYSFLDSDPVYYLNYFSDSKWYGTVILCKVNNLLVTNQSILGISTNQIKFYIKSPKIDEKFSKSQVFISGRWKDKNENSIYESFRIDENDLSILSQDHNWKLFSINTEDMYIDPLSLLITIGPKNYHTSVQKNSSASLFQRTENTSINNLQTDENDTVFNFKFENDNFGTGVNFYPVTLNSTFSVQLLVKPAEDQRPNTTIIGNYPGYNDFEGFFVLEDFTNQNNYVFAYGTGKAWESGIKFHLEENKWNYLVISVSNQTCSIYKNGILMGSREINRTIKNSLMPLCIGNWKGNDRRFNGQIKEVMITNSSVSSETIKSNWEVIQKSV